jgi:hypothetical protein
MLAHGSYKDRQDKAAAEREARFNKIDDLLGMGYTVDQIAEDELGIKRNSVARQAQRWGRPDLAAKFKTR